MRVIVCVLILTFCLILASPLWAWDWEEKGKEAEYPREYLGKRYKYDLMGPQDQIRYDLDIRLHLEEDLDVRDQMRREVDPLGGRFRGAIDK